MIQFNLLPDVKAQYINAQRIKHLVVSIACLVTAVSLVIFIALFGYVDISQKHHLNELSNDITTSSSQLKSNANLNKILTIQNQLKTLPQLDDEKPVVTRLSTYITELTPATASISSLQVDFSADTFSITGTANGLSDVNQFIDAIKFSTYSVTGSSVTTPAFSTVVLSSFGYSTEASNGQPANFTITFNYDPTIFSDASNVTLTVPQQATTRSILSQPTDLFVKSTNNTATNGGDD
jgi:hypothetical protein